MTILPSDFSEPSRYSSKYSRANEVDGGRLMQLGSGGEAADDASIPAAIHKHSKSKNNHHMLPNGDGGRTPIRIPVPPVTRDDGFLSPPCFYSLSELHFHISPLSLLAWYLKLENKWVLYYSTLSSFNFIDISGLALL